LCLTGVIFELDYVKHILFPDIEEIKKVFFKSHPDDPIIFHRKELLKRKPPFSALKEPEVEERFNKLLLEKLESWEYSVISVIIDKKEHNERYSTWKYDPYHYCQEILVERFRLFLNLKGTKGDIMFESRGGKEDIRLKRSFRKILDGGTHHLSSEDLLDHYTSRELKVKPKSANISGLQIADLIAHPCRRWFYKKIFNMDDGKITFSDEIIKILDGSKFFRYRDIIYGYGAKKLP